MFASLNLKECYQQLHGTPPPTCFNSTCFINSSWCSSSPIITQTGFSACGYGVSKDHRLGWLDVSYKSAFGNKIPKVINPSFVLVKYQDPRCHKKYNTIYKEAISQNGALCRTKLLSSTITPGIPLTEVQQKEYEAIDNLKLKASQITEKNAANLGGVEFHLVRRF